MGGGVLAGAGIDGVQQGAASPLYDASAAPGQPGRERLILELARRTQPLGDVDQRLAHVVNLDVALQGHGRRHGGIITSGAALINRRWDGL